MWKTEYTAESPAGPEAIWQLMADVSGWPRWNKAVEAVELDGPFEAGTPGRLGQGDSRLLSWCRAPARARPTTCCRWLVNWPRRVSSR